MDIGQNPRLGAKKTLLAWTREALWTSLFVLGLLFAAEKPAHAYTDPGSGALIWQMLAAGFVGLLFYFRKFTGWFKARNKDNKD